MVAEPVQVHRLHQVAVGHELEQLHGPPVADLGPFQLRMFVAQQEVQRAFGVLSLWDTEADRERVAALLVASRLAVPALD